MNTTTAAAPTWEDVCFAMCLECERDPDEPGEALPASAALVYRYIRRYPQFADDLIDFAATDQFMRLWVKLHPAPVPTQWELDAAVKRAMKNFERALRERRSGK